MLTRADFHTHQEIGYEILMNKTHAGLLMDMGLGKTVTTLTALKDLIWRFDICKPLIIAPKRVTETTWPNEVKDWAHLQDLEISVVKGSPRERIAALNKEADIYCIGRDNVKWLQEHYKRKFPFDCIVVDESSSFKDPSSQRFKAIQKVLGMVRRVVILTATPLSTELMNIWPQIYMLDKGARLYETQRQFRSRYFTPAGYAHGYVTNYELVPGAKEAIYKKLSDICVYMAAEDWLKLRPRVDIVQQIELPDMERYKRFRDEQVLQLEDQLLTPVNAGVLYGKLLQFCNGAVYDQDKNWHLINNEKLDALEENIEALCGHPVIVFYAFKSDLERIQKRIPQAVLYEGNEQFEKWNRGEIPVMLAHPQSCGHGLNLQKGGRHMIWFGLPWSLELYLQACGRIDRQGKSDTLDVINKILIAKGTIEEVVKARIEGRYKDMKEFLNAFRIAAVGN